MIGFLYFLFIILSFAGMGFFIGATNTMHQVVGAVLFAGAVVGLAGGAGLQALGRIEKAATQKKE
jgi:hypothetical protein